MKKVLAGFLVVALSATVLAPQAFAESMLVREVARLRDGLPLRDRSRPALTLRLADALFDEIGELTRKGEVSPAQTQEVKRLRRKALGLYRDAMTGESGAFTPLAGTIKTKVQFQIARLHTELSESDAAMKLWRELSVQTQMAAIQREAALRLAEIAENGTTRASALEAEKYFTLALDLCGGGETCDYVRYRRAWLFHRTDRNPEAIVEMKRAVVDARGAPREEAIRDLILFFSKAPDQLQDAMMTVEALGLKLGRPSLLADLSGAYYAAGDRASGTQILEHVNQVSPTLVRRAKLLEEHYGFQDWDKFHEHLSEISNATEQDLVALDEQGRAEAEKIMRRLAVQLDGERISRKRFTEEFQSLALAYLKIFPKGEARKSMVDGWLAAEQDPDRKMVRLAGWIAESAQSPVAGVETLRLRELRAATAQKAGKPEIVAEEMAAAAAMPEGQARVREFRYLQARALYEHKDYATALPVFQSLAKIGPQESPGAAKYSVESQNLALDILGLQKRYADVVAQASTWTDQTNRPARLATEFADFAKIAENARFEQAVALGETGGALETFQSMCVGKRLLPQSCTNAKILAVKLKNQDALLVVLTAQGDSQSLAAEYEASAHFAEAARLLEKQKVKGAPGEMLRIALLYEIAKDDAGRDRLIQAALNAQGAKPIASAQEPLWFETVSEVSSFLPRAERLAWTPAYAGRVADALENSGRGNARTRARLLASRENTGPAWEKLVLERIQELAKAASAVDFHGRNGQRKFQARVARIKKLVDSAEIYLPAAPAGLRTEIALQLMESHAEVATGILESPIPDSVTGEALENVKASLASLAEPFQAKAKAYSDLAKEQALKIGDVDIRARIERKLASAGVPLEASGDMAAADRLTTNQAAPIQAPAPAWGPAEVLSRDQAFVALHSNPSNLTALTELKNLYARLGSRRLSAYFQGRVLALTKPGAME